MATVLTDDSNYTAIAAAIREKNGSTDVYKPTEMAAAISALSSGGSGGALKYAIITGTSSKFDISNYVKDKNFIFVGTALDNSTYYKFAYMPWTEYYNTGISYVINGGGFHGSVISGQIIGTSVGINRFYDVSSSDKTGFLLGQYLERDYLSYSNGIITNINTSKTKFGTSALLIYIGEDDS